MFSWEHLGCRSPPSKPCKTVSDIIRVTLAKNYAAYFWAMLERGVNINTRDEQNRTALHLAIYWKKYLRIVNDILVAGADRNAVDSRGNTPLHAALLSYSSLPIIKALLNAGAEIEILDSLGRSPLMISIQRNSNISVIKTLLSAGADVNAEDLMVEAVNCKADPELISCLIGAGVSVNCSSTGTSPLTLAVLNDDLDVVKLLLAAGATVNVLYSDLQSSLLHLVTGVGVAEELIKYGIELNEVDNLGKAPLHIAVSRDFVDIAETLIRAGADIHLKVMESRDNCFHYARSGAMVKMLASHGANVNARNRQGSTPLHLLVVVTTLLPFGVVEDEPSVISERNCISGVKEMIKCGADLNATDFGGISVLESAINSLSSKMAVYMIKRGVKVSWGQVFSLSPVNYDTISHMIREWVIVKPSGEGLFDYPFGRIPQRMVPLLLYAHLCKAEIDLMKQKKVNCYNSIYHYVVELSPRIKALRICPHCEINDENYKDMFPIYKNVISVRLNKSYRRAGMLDVLENIDVRVPGAEGKGVVSLKNDCKLAIAEHLSNKDLVSFLLAMGMKDSKEGVRPKMVNCANLSPPCNH